MTTYPAIDTAVKACDALRGAMRAAGICHRDPCVVEDPIIDLRDLRTAGATRLATLLRSEPAPHPAGSDSPCSTDAPERAEAHAARDGLAQALHEAGISADLTPPTKSPHTGHFLIHIERMDATAAQRLASLVRASIRDYTATANALHSAFTAHNLHAYGPIPTPTVTKLRIALGDISVPGAYALGTLLGAPPLLTTKVFEVPAPAEAEQVMNRLGDAVNAATSDGFLDLFLHPCCEKCGHLTTIEMGALTLHTTKRLLAALPQPAVKRPAV